MTDDTAAQLAKHIAAVDVEAFAWLLGLEFCHGEEAQEAKDTIVAALSHLATPSLPKEIAGLIERAHRESRFYGGSLLKELADALRALAQKNEKLKAAAVPLCIGAPLIGILAKEGAWQSSTGQCVMAADELHGNDPYGRIRELEAENNSLRDSVDAVRAEYLQPYMNATSRLRELEAERDAVRNELHEVASFIEPHWQGAGAKLEANWIIRIIGEMNSEADAIRAKTFEECVTSLRKEHDATGSINAQRALKEAIEAIRALAQADEK